MKSASTPKDYNFNPASNWRTCVTPIEETDTSSVSPGMDECTTTEDCDDEEGCYMVDYSMGVSFQYNTCVADECQDNSDCDEYYMCVPAGAWNLPRNKCIFAECLTDIDCSNGSNSGVCAPSISTCYSLPQAFSGFYCHFPTDGCITNDDCGNGESCLMSIGGNLEDFSCGFEFCPAK
ncbi:MAG: hypothetical protein JXX29_08755 [Deltaproteobacteria bacterium]|nr:hypothetical protein [Deltaproteobacteria bacterium]MBN2671750.1 hypothetical protein [Deltaproteobacteria bacterium]